MRYFMDTEFIEDGKTIDLISIGIVSEDDRLLYCCNAECDLMKANAWVKKHVIPLLPQPGWKIMAPQTTGYLDWVREGISKRFLPWRNRKQIKEAILDFMPPETKPEIWAYFADYDWVVFCQLFGKMIDLPKGYPMWCRDLKQLMWHLQISRPPKPDKEHDAIEDALWNKQLFEKLAKRAGQFSDSNLVELRF